VKCCTHVVGFRGDEGHSTRRVFGEHDFIHMRWHHRAQREIAPGDIVVFAKNDSTQPPSEWTGDDMRETVEGLS